MADQDYPNLYADMEASAQRTRAAAIAFEHVLGGPRGDMVPVNGYPDQPTIAGRVLDRVDQLASSIIAASESTARFVGSRPTAPTVRRDGTPLQTGDNYFNTTDKLEYLWNGTQWFAPSVDGQQASQQISALRTEVQASFDDVNVQLNTRLPVFASFAEMLAYSGPAKSCLVLSRVAGVVDESGGVFDVIPAGRAHDGGVYLVGTKTWRRKFEGYVRACWYGVKGGDWTVAPLTVDYSDQCQAAVNLGCNEHGGVIYPGGHIRVDKSIKYPNKGFDVLGCSGTRTEFICNVAGTKIFDFTGCNGPAKTMRGVGFSNSGGGYQTLIGIYTENTNGLYLDNCWSRGLQTGLRYHGSFINLHNCAFEYNYWGVYCDTACTESTWTGNTFYNNEQVDVWLTGNNATFVSVGSNHIRTRIECWRLDSCNDATILGVTCQNDGQPDFTPTIMHVTGVSSGNTINGLRATGYGKYGLFLEGANVVKNRFTNVVFRNTAAVGNRAVRCSSSSGNYIEGVVEGWEAGLELLNCADEVKLRIASCSVGMLLNGANYSVLDVIMQNNTLDVSCTNTTIIDLLRFDGKRAGLDVIPYLVMSRGYNSRVLVNGAAPTSLAWAGNWTAQNRVAAAGQVSTWRLVTDSTTGNSGTWKVESTLAA